jgi:DNA-binding CsgD family transcriptional regulator
MGKSTRVRLRDIRHVYRIVNEIADLGHDPDEWRPHLAAELLKLSDLQSCHLYVMPLPVTVDNANIGKIAIWGLDETANRMWCEYGARGDLSADPCTPEIMRRMQQPFTSVRSLLVNDRDWYTSPYFNDFKKQMRSDDILVSIVPMPQIGILHGIGGDRRAGSKPMGRREIICTGLIHQELARRWHRSLAQSVLIERKLSRRLRELLGYLRGSDSEKDIAARMGLSPHTVHNHVRRLYREFKVSSRAELLIADNKQRLPGVPRLGVAGL